jgi:hypothetical protein
MDYMDLVKRSFSNAWKYKFLWFFGFFVSITDGFGGGTWWTDKLEHKRSFVHIQDFCFRYRHLDIDFDPVLIAMIALAIFAIWVLFFVLAVLSEGALIRGVSRKEFKLDTGFSDCWSVGFHKFFRLFGIILLAVVIVIMAIVFLVILSIPMFFASVVLGVLSLFITLPVLLAAIFVVVAVEGWAIRYGILYDMNWLDAIAQGWRLFKNNIGRTIGVAFTSFISQFIMWVALVLCAVALAIPFVLIGYFNFWIGLLPGIGLAVIVIILSSAFFGLYASSVWTLGFMKMTGYRPGEEGSKSAST